MDFDIAPFVTCILGDDVDFCRAPVKANMALYIGGMGARDKNFYNDYAKALGFEDAAIKIQASYAEHQIITSDPRQLLEIEEAKKEFDETLLAEAEGGVPAQDIDLEGTST